MIHEKIVAILKDAGAVAKDQQNKDQKFAYRGIDQVVQHVNPLLKQHGVVIIPTKIVTLDSERFENVNKKIVTDTNIVVEYTWFAEDGSSITTEVAGSGRDFADKATAKAGSVALRTLLLQALMLPTGDTDPDAEHIEVDAQTSAPTVPKAETTATVKADITQLLDTRDAATIKLKGNEFFGTEDANGWSNDLTALTKWRTHLTTGEIK